MSDAEELAKREAKMKSLLRESIECHRAFSAQIDLAERDNDAERVKVIRRASRRAQDAVVAELKTLRSETLVLKATKPRIR